MNASVMHGNFKRYEVYDKEEKPSGVVHLADNLPARSQTVLPFVNCRQMPLPILSANLL